MRNRTTIETLRFIVSYCLLALLAYTIQANTILNGDVGSLLHDTKLFLQGGTYVKDFFETNPPLIFILYSPVFLFLKIAPISLITAIRLYVIALAIISLCCCTFLLNKIIKKEDSVFKKIFLYTLTFLFLFYPVFDFGQREHIALILIFPYLLATILFIHSPKNTIIFFSCLIGIMAAFGFGLKPYFLPALVLIESYIFYKKKTFFKSVRVESFLCITFFTSYLFFIYYLHPDYLKTMLPLINRYYHISIKQSWGTIFSQCTVIYCFLVVFYYRTFIQKYSFYPTLSNVIFLSLVGFIIAFLIPQNSWHYHVYPAFSLAVILSIIYLFGIFSEKNKSNFLSSKEICFLLTTIYIVPLFLYILSLQYAFQVRKNFSNSPLVSFLNKQPTQKIYCFSDATTGLCFPLVYMTHHEFVGRFPFFWWAKGVSLKENETMPVNASVYKKSLNKDKNYFIDNVTSDLMNFKPDIIIVKEDTLKTVLLKNDSYKTAWDHYYFMKKVGIIEIYKRK